jgi:translation elongation factor EF-Tu-like GTPase
MEREIAARVGGKVTSGSGNKMEKGDVRLRGVVRIEAKTTKNASFSVTLEMIEKIENAALSADELPIIVIEFNREGKPLKQIVVAPAYVLDSLGYSNG